MKLLIYTFIILSVVKEVDGALSDILVANQWLAGWTPDDGQNPWAFYSNGRFKTLKDDHGGVWGVDTS